MPERKERYPQQRTRPEADQSAEPVVGPAERRPQGTAANSKLWKQLTAGHHDVKLDAEALNRFATWMDTYAQRTGHYSEEQEKELVKFREQLSILTR